jgi:hypothetical protein
MDVRMAGRPGTFGWLRTTTRLRTMVAGGPHMALASTPGTTTDGVTSPVDAYLLEMYRQAAETTRPSAGARASSIGAFLAFVGLVIAVLAVIFTIPEGESGPLIPAVCMTLGVVGLAVSISFYALDGRRQGGSGRSARLDAETDTAASIYLASIGFFGFAVAIGTALLLLR